LEPREIAKIAARALDGKKARDIRILGVTDLTVLADFFVIATGTSSTHLRTLTDEVEFELKKKGEMPGHTEGRDSGNWLLLDYGAVIVHIFLEDTRSFYSLEHIWSDAKPWQESEL